MKIKKALLISALITLLVFLLVFNLSREKELQSAEIERIIDADTFLLKEGGTIRLLNINAPEKSSSLHALSMSYIQNKNLSNISLEIINTDIYDRYLAKVYYKNDSDLIYLNLELVSNGFASSFLVSDEESKEFKRAEDKAILNQFGIWKHSSHYSCFSSQIFPRKEIVILENSCNFTISEKVNLKDESTKSFEFNLTIFPNSNKTIYLNLEPNESSSNKDIFLLYKNNVLNNDKDSIYLFDSQEQLIHYNHYGYF